MKVNNLIGKVGAFAAGAVLAANLSAAPSIEVTNVQQQYPWTNTVDIVYDVSGVPIENTHLVAVFVAKTAAGDTLGTITNEITAAGTGLTTQWQPPFEKQETGMTITPYIYRENNTSRSYVMDGLVAMWDGIDNAGYGKHDSSAKVWVDLINGWNGTLGANTSWAANSFVVSGDGYPCTVPENISRILQTKNFTIEVVAKPSRTGYRCTLFGNHYAAQAYNFEAYQNGSLRCYYCGNPDYYTAGGYYKLNTIQTCTATSTPSNQKIYYNAAEIYNRSAAIGWDMRSGCKTVLAGEMARPTMAARGNFYCFRLYNRALTKDELARNREVDMLRFK